MVYTGPIGDPWTAERELCDIWYQPGLTDEDREWLRHQIALMDKEPPTRDIRWIKFEAIR